MKLNHLLKYSVSEEHQFIAGSKDAEIDYLTFHFKRFKLLNRIIRTLPKGKLLDIGTTPFTFFTNENTHHIVFAFDFDNWLKQRSEKNNIQFISGDITKGNLPYENNFFDIVLFAEVFEHLHADPVKVLKSLFSVLTPGGVLIFGTPNLASLANRVKLLFNKAIFDYPTWDEKVHGHDRLFVKNELSFYLLEAGFVTEKISYSSCLDFIPLKSDSLTKKRLKKLMQAFLKPFTFLFPSLKGTIIIIAKKPTD